MGPLGVGNITITPSVTGTSYSLSQFDATGTHTVDGNIFDGTGSAGTMDQLHSVDTRVSITGYDGITTTLIPTPAARSRASRVTTARWRLPQTAVTPIRSTRDIALYHYHEGGL